MEEGRVCFFPICRVVNAYHQCSGPLNRGQLGDEDVLSEKALDLGVKKFLAREEAAGGGELRFSVIALAQSLD